MKKVDDVATTATALSSPPSTGIVLKKRTIYERDEKWQPVGNVGSGNSEVCFVELPYILKGVADN